MSDFLPALLRLAVLVFAVSSMLSVGCGYTLGEILRPLRKPSAVVRTLIANFILVPLLALAVIRLLPMLEPIAIGLFLVATAAGAPFLIKLSVVADADEALSASFLVLLLPMTIVCMPMVVPLALPEAHVSTAAIARPLVLAMLLPLSLGLLFRKWQPERAQRLRPPLGTISTVALITLMVAAILQDLPGLAGILRPRVILATFTIIAGAFVIGFALGGPRFCSREVLGLATAQRNISAAAVVATQVIRHPDTIAMVVFSALMGFAVLFPIAGYLRRQTA
jgi:BASS family bile acid:Na+ symporter